ncbi:zinc finger protein 462-like [Grus japonensis]|uniref:Zinc finger protein 462-like n=1 Tax=Grus japonensis TaxID=30415 RepID=A0ABC9X1N7_GRUJA
MPAGSKTDPPLAKIKPISNGGSVSEITQLRSKKTPKTNHQEQLQPERGVRRCERNNSADTKNNQLIVKTNLSEFLDLYAFVACVALKATDSFT